MRGYGSLVKINPSAHQCLSSLVIRFYFVIKEMGGGGEIPIGMFRCRRLGMKHCKELRNRQVECLNLLIIQHHLLIHEADPQSRPVVIIVFAHVVRS